MAWILIIAGIIYAITNLYFSLGAGILFSILIFVLSFFPGRYYLTIGKNSSKHNKLTNSSLILTIIGLVLIIMAFLALLITCPLSDIVYCEGFGLISVLIFGVLPAAFLYALAIILLLINKFKK